MTIPEQFLPQILIALEQYAAYMHATNRDPGSYRAIADQLRQPGRRSKSKPAQTTRPKTHSPSLEDGIIFRIPLDL